MIVAMDYIAVVVSKPSQTTTVETAAYQSAFTGQKNLSKLNVYKKIKKIIIQLLGVKESEVTLLAAFTNDLGADSLDTVELVMEFEKEFSISIPDAECEKLTTVGKAVNYVWKVVNTKGSKKKPV